MQKPIEAPPLSWFFGNDAQRTLAKRYWIRETISGLGHVAVYKAMRLLPIDAVSNLGEKAGHIARKSYPAADRQAHENWARLRPDEADRAEAVTEYAFRQTGRVHWEFAVLSRLHGEGRIKKVGGEHLDEARAQGRPIIVAGLHLANWEIGIPTVGMLGHDTATIYQVPPNRFDHSLAVGTRRAMGSELLPQGPAGARKALRILQERKRVLAILIDECIDGHVHAPFFGRPLRLDGNMARAARFAALTDAAVILAHAERGDGLHFKVTFEPPFDLVRHDKSHEALAENVTRINAIIEPIVRAHLDQWFWLFDLKLGK